MDSILHMQLFEKGLCLEPLPNFETKGECDEDD
jgi:hypothetical protein